MYSIGALLCVLVVTLLALPSLSSLSFAPLRFFVLYQVRTYNHTVCSGTLCSIFRHNVVISPLTFPGHPCHHPRPPHLHHFIILPSSHCCPCVLTVMVIVALAYAHHTVVLMCCRLTVSPACISSVRATWQTSINVLQDVSLALA